MFVMTPNGAYVTISNVSINLGDDDTITPGESINLVHPGVRRRRAIIAWVPSLTFVDPRDVRC